MAKRGQWDRENNPFAVRHIGQGAYRKAKPEGRGLRFRRRVDDTTSKTFGNQVPEGTEADDCSLLKRVRPLFSIGETKDQRCETHDVRPLALAAVEHEGSPAASLQRMTACLRASETGHSVQIPERVAKTAIRSRADVSLGRSAQLGFGDAVGEFDDFQPAGDDVKDAEVGDDPVDDALTRQGQGAALQRLRFTLLAGMVPRSRLADGGDQEFGSAAKAKAATCESHVVG